MSPAATERAQIVATDNVTRKNATEREWQPGCRKRNIDCLLKRDSWQGTSRLHYLKAQQVGGVERRGPSRPR